MDDKVAGKDMHIPSPRYNSGAVHTRLGRSKSQTKYMFIRNTEIILDKVLEFIKEGRRNTLIRCDTYDECVCKELLFCVGPFALDSRLLH